jgi:hypothetical protein
MDFPLHRPARGGSRRTRRGPEAPPPSSGRPRRGGAAPAFVGASNSSPSAPRVSPWGLGNRSRLSRGPVSHEAGRLTDLVGQYYTLRYSTSDSICLYNVKNHKTCSGYLSVQKNIIVILVSPATDKFYLSIYD